MAFKYAKRMDNIKASEIRELLKVTQNPEIISFGGGFPAAESFPIDELMVASAKVLKEYPEKALQYGPTDGYLPLREQIAKRMNNQNISCGPDDVLITSGSQQGLEFSAKIFINPGDGIICESPTYLGALNAFKAYEPVFFECDTDENGMIPEHLEELLKTKSVKFIYVIPDFQNPSGNTWARERREKLVELANKYDVIIIEDNPYGDLRYEGESMPAVKSLDTEGRVIFLGTFSKILCPGYRLGWVVASPELLSKYNFVKQGADLQSSTTTQMEAAEYLIANDLDAHIKDITELYRTRRDAMISAMEEMFPPEVSFTRPQGGLFLWLTFPKHVDGRELAKKAIEKKVAFVPGGAFYPHPGHENYARLNYSACDEEKIREGIKRLAEVIKEEI